MTNIICGLTAKISGSVRCPSPTLVIVYDYFTLLYSSTLLEHYSSNWHNTTHVIIATDLNILRIENVNKVINWLFFFVIFYIFRVVQM